MGAQDREVYFVFGSICRVLSGKIPLQDWKTTVQDIWHWSVQTTRDLNGTAVDVPHFSPPPQGPAVVPPNGTSGIPLEAPALPGTPADPPGADVNDIQAQAFINRCHRQGMSDEGMKKFLRENGISEVAKIPVAKGRALWNRVRSPETAQQYR